MTEKEAIRYLECFEEWNEDDEWLRRDIMEEFIECCTKALTEIQQYREMDRKLRLLTNEDADMWDAYRAVGTVEECREAMEKQKEKKCVIDHRSDHMYYRCPSCGQIQLSTYAHGFSRLGRITKYCENCGQALAEKEGKID